MPQFHFKAKKRPGKIIEDVVDAKNIDDALNKIIQSGCSPIDIVQDELAVKVKDKKNIKRFHFFLLKKVRPKEVAFFTRQISDLAEASVPILKSLQIVSRQASNPHFKVTIDNMYVFVKDGGAFSNALNQYQDIFSPFFINIIKAGEMSGNLENVLKRLADYLEKEGEIRNKVAASLAYPLLIFAVGLITLFVLLTFVIPNLSIMFDDLDQALPLPTLILMNVSGVFTRYWWLMLSVVAVGVGYLRQWLNTSKGRRRFDVFKLRIPFLGDFIKIVEIGRFARILAVLIESGVVISTALNSVWDTVENIVLKESIKKIAEDVTNGSSLNAALRRCPFFPEMTINMIAVSEETGRLNHGLSKIADIYERQSEQIVKVILSLLGPMVLIVIVVLVGFMVMAMLLPIFRMNLIMQ